MANAYYSVTIIRSVSPTAWYSGMIGETFKVVGRDGWSVNQCVRVSTYEPKIKHFTRKERALLFIHQSDCDELKYTPWPIATREEKENPKPRKVKIYKNRTRKLKEINWLT